MKQKYKKTNHHRLPRACGGTDDYPVGNVILVSKRRHEAYHQLFSGERCLESIVNELNNVWIRPDKMLIIVDRKQGDPNQLKLDL